ncbi:NAD(P)H-dependent oxidoreductase subunit E [Tepidimicrobium xylanilyticum]|uniref:NAD(P)H-dependent oxidoreductase subunit E n=1 Tax=Tepidimicrobium xylanilyticum TaxID=1123352 RepID=UPI00264E9E09|nr:NAD(P)H-dependent oxidoreductase subunit E [Tepidimicrobium xylanilyticum]GMG96493.1 hypothetical protein EN5CB1_13190 [Tepidimicrobium xylanilyticum]
MKVKVCMGSNCTLLGAMNLLDQIEDLKKLTSRDDEYNDMELDIEVVKCLGYCKESKGNISPVVVIDDEVVYNATGQIVMEKILKQKSK